MPTTLPVNTALEQGQKLIIPAAERSETAAGKSIRYRVRRTDTVGTIADEFDVTTVELRKWNRFEVGSRGTRHGAANSIQAAWNLLRRRPRPQDFS